MSVFAIRFTIAAVAIAVTVAFLIIVTGQNESAGPERGDITLRELLDDPEDHLGQTVVVSGEVNRLDVATGAFTIGDRFIAQENELFVLATRDSGFRRAELSEDSVVRVQGTVRRIEPALHDDDDLLHDDSEDDAFDDFEGELAVKATRIELLEG